MSVTQLFDTAPVGFFISKPCGLILSANKTFLELISHQDSDVFNKKRFVDFLSVGGKLFYETHYAPLLHIKGKVDEVSLELIRPDRSKIPVLINSVSEAEKDGSKVIKSTVFDISHRKIFEKELIEARKEAENLSDRLQKANKELQKKTALIQKQKNALEKLNNIKDKYFGIISHDLRSPLHNIKSFIYLLSEHIDDFDKKDIQNMVDKLKSSVDNTLDLADDLVIWGHAQMKKLEGQKRKIKLERLIGDIVKRHQDLAQKKDIVLSSSIEDGLFLKIDKYQLAFIIRNLLINAIKFTPNGGYVNISAKSRQDEKIQISIKDTGVGMSVKQLEALFSPDMKSTKGTAGEIGSGLGLSMVKEFINMNNATISVESKLDEGTCFTIII